VWGTGPGQSQSLPPSRGVLAGRRPPAKVGMTDDGRHSPSGEDGPWTVVCVGEAVKINRDACCYTWKDNEPERTLMWGTDPGQSVVGISLLPRTGVSSQSVGNLILIRLLDARK